MITEEKVKTLKTFDFFKDLSSHQINVIAKSTSEKEFEAKDVLMEQEEPADVAYFIYEGSVRVYKLTPEGNEVNLSICGNGEIVGEMALLNNSPRSAYVEAIQHTKVLVLSEEKFREILKTHPEIAYKLLLTLSQRVKKLNEFVEEIFTKKLPDRTWHILELLTKYFPNGEITLSQEELAQIVGATRARVTEILDLLEKNHKIALSHKKIKILQICSSGNRSS